MPHKSYEQVYNDLAALMATQPLAFIGQVIDEIRRHGKATRRWSIPSKITVIASSSTYINSLAEYIDRRHGYRIVMNQGLTALLFDATQLMLSLTTLVDADGKVLSAPEVSQSEARDILQEALVAYVTAREWRTPSLLEVAWAQRWQSETSAAPPHRKDWVRYMQHMLGFVVCHELAHIVLKHPKKREPRTERDQFREECAADRLGTEMMFTYLQSLTYDGYGQHGGPQAARDRNVVSALKAVAVLFTVLMLIDYVAARYGRPTFHTHPSGGWRYDLFKLHCTLLCGIPDEAFSEPGFWGTASPDDTHWVFAQLAFGMQFTAG